MAAPRVGRVLGGWLGGADYLRLIERELDRIAVVVVGSPADASPDRNLDADALPRLEGRFAVEDRLATEDSPKFLGVFRGFLYDYEIFNRATLQRDLARVERALEILGAEAPEHLIVAGELRIKHRQASLEELGQLADPALTKDAIAGRIRRLLALADRRATELGVPSTEAHLTADMLVP